MKILLIFSGMLRVNEISLAILSKQLLNDTVDIDVRCFFYEFKKADQELFCKHFPGAKFSEISPLNLTGVEFPHKAPETIVPNVLSMYYSRNTALNILRDNANEHNNYDMCVYARSDLALSQAIDYQKIESDIIDGKIYIPAGGDYNGINDKFSICSPSVMETYLSVYDSIQLYTEGGVRFHPETLMKHHLLTNKIIIRRLGLIDFIFRNEYTLLYGDYAVRSKYVDELNF